ncbi:RNA pseudouridylate synthase domain-containing protein 1-like [Galleria mellonella]|uniref:RNA pseudouridylate synthase domain-containing protein 1-like n=1 Tax=Galleria mellonella TaxID=7137 RepID=A0A6J1X8D9_GALME|nr:RNA pseudouridylate synthase domain-containing protein 1-like [Galleria mellonella]
MAIEKLYESENYIVVNKPYDMYINTDDETEKNTVTCHIASHDSHLSTSVYPLHFVQRLDYATSGVLCIAKNKTAAAAAGKLFERRETKKYYLAIVRGHVKFKRADIEYNVGIDPATANSSHKMLAFTNKSSASGQSRHAHTRLLVLETGYYKNEPVSVVLLKPITGRRHQLRVHCSAIGHTILGDYTYSNATDSSPHRMFLHATRLLLPVSTEPLDIQTTEPFFQDQQFSAEWKSEIVFYKYRSKEDFRLVCNIIDESYEIGVKYKLFNCNCSD